MKEDFFRRNSMYVWLSNAASSNFAKSISVLASGTALAQLVNIAILPVLSRWYTPTDFGIYALFLALTSILSVLTTGRYEYAILSARNSREVLACVALIHWLVLRCSLLLLLPLFFLLNQFELPQVNSFVITALVVIQIALSGLYQACYFYLNRAQDYARISKARIAGAVAFACVSIVLMLTPIKNYGLIIASGCGMLINLVILAGRMPSAARVSKRRLFFMARKNVALPRYLIPSILMERLSQQFPVLLFGHFFSTKHTGHIGLYEKIVGMPTAVVGNAVGDVFKQRVAKKIQIGEDFSGLLIQTSLILFLAALIPFFVLFFYGEELMTFAFGSEWAGAGRFAEVLCFSFLFGFVVSPISNILYLSGYQRWDLYLQVFLFIMLVCVALLTFFLRDMRYALSMFTGVYCLKYAVEFIICARISTMVGASREA